MLLDRPGGRIGPAGEPYTGAMLLDRPARLIDVSRPLTPATAVWPGDPAVSVRLHSSIERGDPANVSELAMGSHSGTHVDAPAHFLPGSAGAGEIGLDALVGPAVVVDARPHGPAIGPEPFGSLAAGATRVLLSTAASDRDPAAPFTPKYPALTRAAAAAVIARGIRLVGTDAPSIEAFESPGHPVHRELLGAGVVVVEGLSLGGVAPGDYLLVCLPLRIPGVDGAPARAVLLSG